MSKTVLVVGAGRRAQALLNLLGARDDVRRVFLSPGGARGRGKALAAPVGPDAVDRLMRFALGRGVDLIVEGPGGAGLCARLRALHSFRLHRPGCGDALPQAVWRCLPGGVSSAWRVAAPPAPAEPHTPYVPMRSECERDKAYVFTLGAKKESS